MIYTIDKRKNVDIYTYSFPRTDVLIEVWKVLGDIRVNFLTRFFNKILETVEIPDKWKKSVLVPI